MAVIEIVVFALIPLVPLAYSVAWDRWYRPDEPDLHAEVARAIRQAEGDFSDR